MHERVIMIEDLEEIPLLGELWSKLLTRPKSVHGQGELSMQALFAESLRLRPDRLVLGELRGKDFQCFLDAVASGHDGVFASFHAGTPQQLRQRMLSICEHVGWGGDRDVHAVFLQRHKPCKLTQITKLPTGTAAGVSRQT